MSEAVGVGYINAISNPLSTPVALTFPSGLLSLEITFLEIAAATAKYIYLVFDPLDATDAATKLGDVTSRLMVLKAPVTTGEPLPRSVVFSWDAPVYSLYYASDAAAEAGTTLLRLIGKVKP
jgi:hypothetical protein